MSENGEIYTAGNKFYTPAGTDGMDKFHLCDLPVLTCYLTRWCCHCHSLSAWTKSPEVERTSLCEREAWKVYLDDGQFEKLDKVVADCENADDNYEPATCHLKHEKVFSKMQRCIDHNSYNSYSTLSLPPHSNFDIIAQWSSIYWSPKGLRAESAGAVTGRQCPHSGEGENFLTCQPGFFYENGCNSGTESKKIIPKLGNDQNWGRMAKIGFFLARTEILGPKKTTS